MAETKNENHNKSLTAAQKWDVVYKISIVALLFGVFVTLAVMTAVLKKFYDQFERDNFYWNFQWSNKRTFLIATRQGETVNTV